MERRTPLGAIEAIWRYPVKSLHPERLEEVRVDGLGLEGDRRRALFVGKAEHARSGKTYRGKENNLLHTLRNAAGVRALATVERLELAERDDGPYFDDSPVSLLTDRWIAQLEALAGEKLDPQRFRPNFFVRSARDFIESERDLIGATLVLGDVRLRVLSPIERCVVPSYDVETGEPSPRLQRALVQQLGNQMGIYCSAIVAGSVRAGATIEIIREP